MILRRWTTLLTIAFLAAAASAQDVPSTDPCTMFGTVETPDGAALAGARVELSPLVDNYQGARLFLAGTAKDEPVAVTTSDAHGRFRLEAPARGLYVVTVRAEGRVPVRLMPVAVTGPEELSPAVLTTDVRSRVEVRAVDGGPLAGAWVFAHRAGKPANRGWAPAPRLVRTDDDGVAVLPRAAGEWLDVSVFVPSRLRFEERYGVTGAEVRVGPVPEGRRTIEVRDERGAPAAGVVVALGGLGWSVGVTGEDGRLEVPAPSQTPLPIRLLAEDGRSFSGSLDERPALLVLTAAHEVDGRVLRETDRRPVGGALVWPAHDPGAFSFADEKGRFRLNVPGRRASLRVDAAGFVPAQATATLPADVEVVLEVSRAGFGRVVDPEGRPVAGARIELRVTGAPPQSEGLAAVTGADGRFDVARLPDGRVDLVVLHRGYAPTRVHGIPTSGGPVPSPPVDLGTLILEAGASIRGVVRDVEGTGVADAAVWLSHDLRRPATDLLAMEPPTEPLATTGADGSFVIEDLEPGRRFHVLLRADAYQPAAVEAVTAPTEEPLSVVLKRGATVRGRVVDEAEEPVAGATVVLRPAFAAGLLELPPQGHEHVHDVVTEADGTFRFTTVAAGRFEATADADDFLRSAPRTVSVPAGGAAPELIFMLARGATLSGRVTTDDGRPLAGVRISVGDAGGTSDGEGAYRVSGISPGLKRAEARHRSLNGVDEELEIEDGENVHDFVLAAGRPVRGRVVDGDGEPVEGARVDLEHQDFENHHRLVVLTDAEGLFELAEVAEGRYGVWASKAGYAWVELPEPLVVAGEAVDDVEVVLPLGTVLAGHVRGFNPDELADLEVVAEGPAGLWFSARVDYEGAYEIADLGPGGWLVRTSTPDGRREARARIHVGPGVRRLERDLELGGGFTLDARVLLAGEPLAGAHLSLHGLDVTHDRKVLADHDGAARFEDLPPGTYRLAASHPREVLVTNREVTIAGDQEVTVEIEGAKVHGWVRSSRGEPLAGARVLLHQLQDDGTIGSLYSVDTGNDGYFALPRITAGRYRVTARHDGYVQVEEEVELLSGAVPGPLSYALEPAAGLVLVTAFGDGRRPSWVTVRAVAEEGGTVVVGTVVVDRRDVDASGEVRFPTLAAGDWHLAVSAPGSALAELDVTVPGEPVPVALAEASRLRVRVPSLVESDRIAALTLTGAGGEPFQGVDESGLPAGQWTLAGGVGAVEGVPPGLWTVRVEAADGRRWSGTVATGGENEVAVLLE